MSVQKKKLNQLQNMLQNTNKKTKYFLPLIEHYLFPDSNTRKYILESEQVDDNSTENISDEEGENEDDNERDEEKETEDI